MAKRISKKLLAGLGTSLVFSTTAFISSLGVKSIIDTFNNNIQENFQFNRITEAPYSQIPNLSTPTRDMFIDTTRLGNFHAGSVRKGQTLTPWGWLGVYTENNQADNRKPTQQKLALTGWNGEILWVNNDFGGQFFADNKSDIYDIKYDWNTNLIFLARSGNPNGLFKPVDVTAVGENSLIIDVLDAQTGTRLQRIENNSGSTNDLHDFAWRSFFAIRDNFFDVTTDLNRIEDLYSFDIASQQSDHALAFYMPNFMQLYQKKSNPFVTSGTLPNFAQVLDDFQTIARGWIFNKDDNNSLRYHEKIVNPHNSSEITGRSWNLKDQGKELSTTDFYLLTNPFWTATNRPNEFILHFIVGNAGGDVYHKIIGFNLTSTQADRNPVLSNFDKTEQIGSSANATNSGFNIKLEPNKWGNNANTWNANFINANLRINKNMFDNNIISFAFPVEASQETSNNFPIFDIAQIKIKSDGLIDKTEVANKLSSKVFNLGSQILEVKDTDNNNPWPNNSKQSLTHNYHYLVSISPFDNTFIYNAMPNLQGVNSAVYNSADNSNKFLNFWLVDPLTGKFKPFVISNDSALGGTIPDKILRPNQFLNEGFTFDLKSLITKSNKSDKSINLYFNHSGADRNDWYGSPAIENVGMRSAKIGLFNDVINSSSVWVDNITSIIANGRSQIIEVTNDSFATLIHSRADMTKWYARTEFNFNKPGNLWKINEQINKPATSSDRVQATVFNQRITDNRVKQQDGVDLVSHWQVGRGKYNGSTTDQSNYNRLVVKRPTIRATTINNSRSQVLPIKTSYDIDKTIKTKYKDLFSFNNSTENKLTFDFEQEIQNASWEIFSSWSKDAKMLSYATSSDNVSAFTSSLTEISEAPKWYDARQNSAITGNDLFAKVHNAISPNTAANSNEFSLRTMLKIEKPTDAPAWLNRANNKFFEPYPISGSEYEGETSFQDILSNFITWKSKNIDLSENQESSASGLANLTIKAFLQVNPRVVKPKTTPSPKIYKNKSKQILLLDSEGQAIIYDDKYNEERIIYDQSANNYQSMTNYGYGNSVQNTLKKSFKNVPVNTEKLLINTDLNDLPTTLLTKNNNQNADVFSVEYQSQQQDKLVIKPANPGDQNWFNNRFSSFNKMLNLFVVFEYQNQNDDPTTGQWKSLLANNEIKLWTDNELKENLTKNNNAIVLNTDKKDIKRIRVRLATKTNNGNPVEVNDFIKWKNWDANNSKLISKVHTLQPQKIIVKNEWFNTISLSAQNSTTLDQLTISDINNYERLIREELKKANNNSEIFANQVEISYIFENKKLNAGGLINAIKTALNDNSRQDKGIFTLWDGTKGLKIRVQFEIKANSSDNYILVDSQGIPITDENERSGDLKTNIATKIDLSDYFNQLETSSLQAVKGLQNGELKSFEMPQANTGKFNNQTYNEIINILNAVGLSFQFKEQNGANNWSNWMEKNEIKSYNPQDPSLMIGLKINNGFNIKVFVKNVNVDTNYAGIKVKLNLPKLVKFPVNENDLVNKFNEQNPFGGNTYKLEVDTNKLALAQKNIVNILKNASQTNNSGNYDNLESALDFKYQLGDSNFLAATDLKDHLLKITEDQTSNILKIKISIKQTSNTNPEFILDASNNEKEFVLQLDNNLVIKKWIHGKKYENALKETNSIVPNGNRNFLTYSFVNDLVAFSNATTFPQGLTLEYQLNGIGNWIQGQLPSAVNNDIDIIKVRVAKKSNESIHVYGPEENNNQSEAVIDLTKIPVLITVDNDWFFNIPITNQMIEMENLTPNILEKWEQKIWEKAAISSDIQSKVTIKYSFLTGSERTNLNKNNLVNKLMLEQFKYDDPVHHGIIKLQDFNQTAINGITIRATFAKINPNDATVQFIDQAGSNIGDNETDKLTGNINTTKIQNTFDLSSYVSHLKNNPSNITTENGVPGTIAQNGLVPPILNGPANKVLFANQPFNIIEQWLKKVGLTFLWSENGQNNWLATDKIKNYNPQIGQLFLGIKNESINLKVKIDNNFIVDVQNNSFNNPITIELNAPKVINVTPTQASVMEPFFSGTTKNLDVNTTGIQSEINKILQGLGNQFQNAPLTLMVQVGDEDFIDYKEIKTFLANKNEDVANNVVTVKFAIDQNQNNSSDFQLINGGDNELTLINDPTKIKIYVNDQNIFADLEKTKFAGTNENLNWNFQQGITVDPNSGQLRKTINGKTHGVGLKLAYSFDKNTWTNKQPAAYDPANNQLFIKIELEDNTKYTYDNLNKIITLGLNLQVNINLQNQWLNQQLFADQSKPIEDFLNQADTILTTYEANVYNSAKQGGIDVSVHDKFSIKYTFDGSPDLLTKSELIRKLKSYKTDKNDTTALGILQLWNQNNGIQIKSDFVDADLNDNFVIKKDLQDGHILDTSKVETTIDFSSVIDWLMSVNMKVPIEEGDQLNSITRINIPSTSNLNSNHFNNRQWDIIEQSLKNFGILIEYKADGNVSGSNWSNLNSVNTYDPANGQVQFRLKFKDNKFTNVKLALIDGQQLDGKTPDVLSNVYKFKLDIKLTLIVDQVKINEFIQSANIRGNTKDIEINQSSEQVLIEAIKNANASTNPEFNNAVLKIQYYLGSETAPNIEWKEWNQFKTDLSLQRLDQKSNRVIFRLVVAESQKDKFSIANTIHVLHDDKVPAQNWTVKYFVNKANLEDSANNVQVTGTSSNVFWNYDSFKKLTIDKEPQPGGNNKILIKNIYGQRILQILFSTSQNIDYNSSQSDDINDITSKWVSLEPTKFLDHWNVSNLYIKLIPVDGYVYEAKEDNTAQRHEISLANLKLEIKVNPDNLKISLDLTNGKKYLHEITVENIKQFIQKAVTTIAINSDKVDVQFKFRNNLLSADELFNEIQKALAVESGTPKNIVQLWNGISGEKIEAKFILKNNARDQYILIDSQNNQESGERFVEIITSNIKTLVDLREIITELSKLKIEVILPNQSPYNLTPLDRLIMPNIPAGTQSELQGLTWEAFENKLDSFGILIEARPKVKGTNSESWTPIANVNKYDSNLLMLELRFKIKSPNGKNIVLSVKQAEDVEVNTNENNLPTFEMSLKAPAKVVVDNLLLDTFIKKDIFRGNTKILNIVSNQPETDLIQAIIAENIKNNPVFAELNNRLEVQYYLGINDPNNQQNINWQSAEGLKEFLANQSTDQITNQIWFRLNVKESDDPNGQVFQVDQSAKILISEDISAKAKIKIYINETGFSAEIAKLKAVGSTDSFTITGLKEWEAKIPTGLEIGYSKEINPDETDDSKWTVDLPTTLSSDKKLWVRFKVKDGYEYQGAKTNNPKYGEKHQINTDGIKVIIKLKIEWLEKIIITGNTKNASVNEQNVLDAITGANVLPTDQPNLIELQYNIKGSSEWFTKAEFESKLTELAGKKDSKNFILKREDLQVRFNIKSSNSNNYGLSIDGENVDENNYSKFNRDIVTSVRNQAFRGNINLDHLEHFIAQNFKITGTTTKPKLIITKREQLNELFMPYVSDGLFDIQFSTIKNQNGDWDWSATNQSILQNGQLIDEDGLINQNVQIGAAKHFAIKFISKNSNYDVYKLNAIQNDGYLMDLSANVKITIEILNPFTADNKTLGIWTRENNNGKYYQGQGGFKIAVANKDTLAVEDDGQKSAQEFLKNSSLTSIEKDALELVYHVFDSNTALDNQIEKVKEAINNYDDQEIWKSFDEIKENENSDWSKDLNLKVGDYVAVALRVKKEYAIKEDPFVLKDNEYSMILPVMNDSSNQEQKPGRISGYKINTNAIEINKDSILITNSASSQLPPLDGWSELQRVDLKPDAQGNYLGANLKLELYTEFHENNSNKVLVSGSGLKLVKRETNNENSSVSSTGVYKDENNQEIKDKTGQAVQIWKDSNNRLSAPIKSSTVTKDKLLISLGGGAFRLPLPVDVDEKDRLSLFKNQDIDLLLVANKGEGTDDLPDFYLDRNDRRINIKDEVSQQIKFMVENEQKITYSWNQDEFSADKIKYKAPGNNPDQKPEDGNAQLDTIYKLTKKTPGSDPQIITANTAAEASKALEQQLEKDFNGQLKFEITYVDKKGQQIKEDGNDIYKFKNLSNKDRIVVKIVAVEEDLFYATDQPPLVINVNGLVEASPDQNRLQYLRVKQGGLIDGQGSFKVLVSNPEKDDQSILNGWKFMIRVWDKDLDEKGKHQIKIPWSDDPAQIRGLANGDKVEWKLVSADGNPVKDAYYNTIALNHQQDSNGNIDYQFGQVNYPNGSNSYHLVHPGIGDYPSDDQYPKDSGFVISGLKPALEVFEIDQTSFKSILQELNLVYVGLDKQGTINIDNKYLEGNYWVNTKGEIYLKDDKSKTTLNNAIEELNEIPIKEFLDNLTFFTQDPLLYPYQNGFKFSANDANINDHLANGDRLWAKFEMVRFKNENDLNSVVNSDMTTSSIILQLPDVSGLTNVSDPVSPFWYVLIALAGILTLGTSSIVFFIVSRNKKLKNSK